LVGAACGPTGSAGGPARGGAAPSGQPAGLPAGDARPASGPAVATAPPVSLKAAFVAISSAMLPAWLGADRGIFEKYGLDVELIYISGLAKISESLVAGEIDFGITPTPSAMGPGLQGADLVAIASWASKNAFSLYTQPSITSVEDLRGKRIATSRRGSLSELWASEVLGRYGMEPERDYAVLPLGGQPEQLAGLQNGAVDAAALAVPTNIIARKAGLRELLGYRENALEFASLGVVTSRHYLSARPDVSERFLKAMGEGVAMMLQDTDASLAVLSERLKVDDREMLEESLKFNRYTTNRDMMPTAEGLQAAMDSLAVNNPAAVGADPTKYVDFTLIRKLNDSGFINSLYR
jgi:NitT/TauT family transport system substrate-binding protein